EIDISRGDMLTGLNNQPIVGRDVEATLCWLATSRLQIGKKYVVKHTTRSVRAVVTTLRHRIDVNTLERDESVATLGLNEIGRVSLRTASPLMYDSYERNRLTGGFILIDEGTNETVAAGIIQAPES
ncbi:MAG TPA: sulfate adenylyltransferase, partial [Chloroflexota bacterium]|nr:sulfate adenylyltransferase [Chloroflexota bacterium]